MMPKVKILNRPDGQFGAYAIYCPGCRTSHVFDDR